MDDILESSVTLYMPQWAKQHSNEFANIESYGSFHKNMAYFKMPVDSSETLVQLELEGINIPLSWINNPEIAQLALNTVNPNIERTRALLLENILGMRLISSLADVGVHSGRLHIALPQKSQEDYMISDDKDFHPRMNPIRRTYDLVRQTIVTISSDDTKKARLYALGKHVKRIGDERYVTAKSLSDVLQMTYDIYFNWEEIIKENLRKVEKKD